MDKWDDPKTVINQNVPVETQNKLLIEKLLDTKAIIESQMANFLILEGNAELLMGYLTRNNNNQQNNENQVVSYNRPKEESIELKRAYQVVQLFIQNSKTFTIFVSVRINNILSSLFNVFKKDSLGSFHHWKAVFGTLLENHPTKVASMLSENNVFFQYFYEFIHVEAVSDALIELLTKNSLTMTDRKKLYSKFNEFKFIQKIVTEKMFQKDEDYPVLSNFVINLIRRLITVQTSNMIFHNISKTNFQMISQLMTCFGSKDFSEEQKKYFASLIKNVFELSKLETIEAPQQNQLQQREIQPLQKITNYLSPFLDTFATQAKNNLNHLLDSLVLTNHLGKEDEMSKDVFTEYRLYLLQVLSFLVSEEDPSILSKFSLPLWKSLVKWFFMHPNNNIYHSLFYKFWRTSLHYNNEAVFRTLFSKCKFITKLISHYESAPHSPLNGFVLLICNTVRFAASVPTTNKFFIDYISSNEPFNKFVPTIIEQTSRQLIPYSSDKLMKLPYPHFQPYQESLRNSISEKVESNNTEVELGSLYAHLIGFNQPPKEKEIKEIVEKSPAKKKNNGKVIENNKEVLSIESNKDESQTTNNNNNTPPTETKALEDTPKQNNNNNNNTKKKKKKKKKKKN